MIRVLHVVGGLNVGGTETWLAKGLSSIDRSSYQFDFLVHGGGPTHYRQELEAQGARVLVCPEPRKLLRYARSFLNILRETEYHAVHAHTYCFSGIVLALTAYAGIQRRIFHSHTAQDEAHSHFTRAAYFRGCRWLIQRYATQGIAVSEEAAKPFFPMDWRSRAERWKISAIGIDLKPFEGGIDRSVLREEFAIPATATVVIHVGRFVPVKNHELLVEIAREVVAVDGNVVFFLVGDGPERAAIAHRVRSLGLAAHFRFTGIRADVPSLLQAADVFMLPSLYEGYPLSYIEAQAAGLPCVISDTIAPAADLVPQHSFRLPVKASPCAWASTLLQAATCKRIREIPEAVRDASIERSMQRMLESYR